MGLTSDYVGFSQLPNPTPLEGTIIVRPAILEAAVDSLTPEEVRRLVSLFIEKGCIDFSIADVVENAVEEILANREETGNE